MLLALLVKAADSQRGQHKARPMKQGPIVSFSPDSPAGIVSLTCFAVLCGTKHSAVKATRQSGHRPATDSKSALVV